MVFVSSLKKIKICVVGLGYVGLPLALSFSKKIEVIGYDLDNKKITRLQKRYKNILFTDDASYIKDADVIIIAVPTPVKKTKELDLSYVESAAREVGKNMKKGSIVVLESTVYPGFTEEFLVPILEKESNMKCKVDFKVGYSPERINPGDAKHSIDKIVKIVAGIDEETTALLNDLYGLITKTYVTENIKTAEAAKVIENIQRDINIALINELAIIFHELDLDTRKVLEAASTKWNFHRYVPGLVGGHCIPVDPYYLVRKAEEVGYHPKVILAGRTINDYMGKYLSEVIIRKLNEEEKVIKKSKILIMGVAYKENVSDVRETPVVSIVRELKKFGPEIYVYDPYVEKETLKGMKLTYIENLDIKVDCIVITVAHDVFKKYSLKDLKKITNENSILIDIKGIFYDQNPQKYFNYWVL